MCFYFMNLKEVLLAIAILVLTIFVTFYGINTIYPKPQYEDFCNADRNFAMVNTTQTCEELDGKWMYSSYEYIVPDSSVPVKGAVQGYCDFDYKCRKDFDNSLKERSRKVFFIALPLGILIVALGAFLFGLEAVGAGLMGGGVGTLIYGSGAYWPYSENWIRFLISLIGLVLLIWFAYFFNKRLGKKKRKRK